MKKLTILLMFIFFTSCSTKIRVELKNNRENFTESIYYFKDNRTNLCFVSNMRYSLTAISSVLSNVPCTKEVEIQIKKDSKN